VFAPEIRDAATIGKLVKAVEAPLNILLQPGGSTVRELEKLGVARASAVPGLIVQRLPGCGKLPWLFANTAITHRSLSTTLPERK